VENPRQLHCLQLLVGIARYSWHNRELQRVVECPILHSFADRFSEPLVREIDDGTIKQMLLPRLLATPVNRIDEPE
jgi:hypothetical protein